MVESIAALSAIAGRFDAVAVDQFGVLHDGRTAFADAVECVAALHARKVPMVALTNSGKRAGPNRERLARLGFPPSWFRGVVSSGELAWQALGEMLKDGRLAPGSGVLVLSRDGDHSVIEGLPLHRVAGDETPALVLIAGVEPERLTRADYLERIGKYAQQGVAAICAAPDRVIYAAGHPAFGAGVVAEDYARAGGEVTFVGKPSRAMFEAVLEALGNPAPGRVLMIGDSREHDVQGAADCGMQTLLVSSGVQADTDGGQTQADFLMDRLRW